MQRGRMLILVAGLVGGVSLLVPFFSAQTLGNVSAITAGGLLPVAAIAGAAVIAAVGDRREGLNGLSAVSVSATVTLAVVLTGGITIDAVLAGRDARDLGVDASIRAGLWLLVGACGIAVVGLLAAMSRRLS